MPTLHMPLVSICIPVYNGGAMLYRALQSSISQSYSNIEILIGDNASEDSTQEIALSYVARDSRVRYIRHEKNIGAPENFRALFFMARGEFVQLLGHDDWLSRSYIAECVETFRSHPEAGGLTTLLLVLSLPRDFQENFILSREVSFRAGTHSTHSMFKEGYRSEWGNVGFAAMVRRKDALRGVGLEEFPNDYYREIYTMKVPMIVDHLFFIKAIMGYSSIIHIHSATYIKTCHETNRERRADFDVMHDSPEETSDYFQRMERGYMSLYAYELRSYLFGLRLFFFTDFLVALFKLFLKKKKWQPLRFLRVALHHATRYPLGTRVLLFCFSPFCFAWRVLAFFLRPFQNKRRQSTLPFSECFLQEMDEREGYVFFSA